MPCAVRPGFYRLVSLIIILFLAKAAWAQENERNFISPDEAFDSLYEYAEVKYYRERKYKSPEAHEPGYNFGTEINKLPDPEFPFYLLKFSVTKDVERQPWIYVSKDIFSKLYYIDAYTGKICPEKEANERIIALKKTQEDLRAIEEDFLKDKKQLESKSNTKKKIKK